MENLSHAPGQQLFIAPVVGLGIGVLFPEQNLVRKQSAPGLPQKTLYDAVLCLHLPRHVVQIFNDPVIGKGNSGLQAVPHAGAVHPV